MRRSGKVLGVVALGNNLKSLPHSVVFPELVFLWDCEGLYSFTVPASSSLAIDMFKLS